MPPKTQNRGTDAFGSFELETASGELFKKRPQDQTVRAAC